MENLKRLKLINMIVYFTENSYVTKTKLMKLLFFSDIAHFKETGRSITGKEYEAWELGPVIKSLYFELKKMPEDLKKAIKIIKLDRGFNIKNKIKTDLSVFSKREKRIMSEILEIFKDANSKMMSDASHEYNSPWEKTKNSKGLNEKIDYLLAIDNNAKISIDKAKEKIKETKDTETFFNAI